MKFLTVNHITFGVQAFSIEWGFNIIWYSHKNGCKKNISHSFHFRASIQTTEWLNIKRYIEDNLIEIQKQLLKLFK